jgi:hypothetical protein
VQLDVFLLSSLGRNVALDFSFISGATDCSDVVAIGPEFSTPKVLFDLGYPGEDLSNGNALDGSHDLCGAVWRYGLDEEMDMIFVGTDFEEHHLIPGCNLHADRLEDLIHLRGKDRTSVLRWTDEMVEHDRYIVASVDMFTHTSEYTIRKARQAAGNLPREIEGVAPRALLVEGATRAPLIDHGRKLC